MSDGATTVRTHTGLDGERFALVETAPQTYDVMWRAGLTWKPYLRDVSGWGFATELCDLLNAGWKATRCES